MSTPKLLPAKPSDTKSVQLKRSMLPVAKSVLSCPPQEQTRTKHSKMPKTPELKSELKKSSQKPMSLSLPRAVSAGLIETGDRPGVRQKPPSLSYNHLSKENQRLQRELSALRSALEERETEATEEAGAMSSEITHLTARLNAATSAVSGLSGDLTARQEQTDRLLSLLEGRGIDPLSGEEVLPREQRLAASRAAAERTRARTEYLDRQTARHTEIQGILREKREELLSLLSEDQQEELGDIIDQRFLASPTPTPEVSHHSC